MNLSKLNSLKIGGKADSYLEINNPEDLQKITSPHLIIGKGTNILFSDKGFRGQIVRLHNQFFQALNDSIKASASCNLPSFVINMATMGYDFSDLSWPGTIGGSVFGNAGTPEADTFSKLLEITYFDLKEKKFHTKKNSEIPNSYRFSDFKNHRDRLIYEVKFKKPQKKQSKEILNTIKEKAKKRAEIQPKGKNAGSFFKNPKNNSAGRLIDLAGCKGLSINDALCSPIHANFLINQKNATQADMIELAKIIKKRVQDKFNIILEPEVQILDEFGKTINL
ncbi:MAG: UDP-N-acetylmuramate dehydrogenase [Candidatus Gracilibacteria bacterium]|jgi:UDP-N-acetylmuramate dehydrogenase|nr:UDP-N-acetylmuramate dehydrogenase [Candidatus Gracilibacteria bacterium]